MDDKTSSNVALATTEAMANVIKHGYGGRTDRPIWVRATPVTEAGRKGLRIVIDDECENVDLSDINSRPLAQLRPGGLGVHIIQQTMDEVDYQHRSDTTGVRLTMLKFLPPTYRESESVGA